MNRVVYKIRVNLRFKNAIYFMLMKSIIIAIGLGGLCMHHAYAQEQADTTRYDIEPYGGGGKPV